MANRPLIIIDSDEHSNTLLTEQLAPHGFDVSSFVHGKEALDMIESAPPSLILLSLELGDMNGYVACKKIKEDSRTSAVPLIIMSKDATEKDFERHRKLKVAAQDYIHKPFDMSEILRKIENLVGFNVSAEAYESLEAKIGDMFESGATDDELKLKQKEIDRQREEMKALRDELLRVKEQLSAGGGDAKAKLSTLQGERDQLARRVAELEAHAVGSEQLAAAQKRLAEITQDRDEVKHRLKQRDVAFAQLEGQTKTLQAEAEKLRGQLAHAAQAEKREADLLQQLESVREQTEMMREDFERKLNEVKETARQALEQALAALNS